jgi:hypothetical protein
MGRINKGAGEGLDQGSGVSLIDRVIIGNTRYSEFGTGNHANYRSHNNSGRPL